MTTQPILRRTFLRLTTAAAAAGGLSSLAACSAADPIQLPTYSGPRPPGGRRLLVAYATAAGSTAEIAMAMGTRLGELGFAVDVLPVGSQPRIEAYDAVILGSAVHYGTWLPEAVAYVHANAEPLARARVVLFCVHIRNRGDDEKSRRKRLAYLDAVRPHVLPVTEAFFPGRFDRRGARILAGPLLAWMMPTVDLLDLNGVREWATRVTPQLSA